MIFPDPPDVGVIKWTIFLGTIIFCAGYLWHHLKDAFPEFFKPKNIQADIKTEK